MKKKNIKYLWIIGIIAVISIVGYFVFIQGTPTNLVEVDGLYDANQNLIKSGLSVIGGVEGVKYITLKITIENKDSVSLNLKVKDMTPIEILSSKPANILTVNSGDTGSWVTGLIDVEPYEGKIQEFCVTVESEKIPALRESSEVSGCISIQVDPNPVGSFDISLNSNIGESAINPGCTESWDCSAFGTCSNSIQTRTCTDINNCGTALSKPSEQQTCVLITECNTANVGIRKCYSATKYQTCLASGSWSGILSCTNACTGQGICS